MPIYLTKISDVRRWLCANYTAQQIAGQPHVERPAYVGALVAWCNATCHLARGGQSKRDREQSMACVAEGAKYLHLVR